MVRQINKLEKQANGVWLLIFRNKQFKNQLDPKYAFYDTFAAANQRVLLKNY